MVILSYVAIELQKNPGSIMPIVRFPSTNRVGPNKPKTPKEYSDSKILAIPQGIISGLLTYVQAIDPSCVHMTTPIMKQVINHLNNSKDDLAISVLKTKTQWANDMVQDLYQVFLRETKEFLLARRSVQAQEIRFHDEKRELADLEIKMIKVGMMIASMKEASTLAFINAVSMPMPLGIPKKGNEDLDFSDTFLPALEENLRGLQASYSNPK